jgi:putative ATP-binding cassette transporter
MELFTLFARQAPNRLFLALLLGALAGAGYALLLPVVMLSVGPEAADVAGTQPTVQKFLSFEVSHYRLAAFFAGVCLLVLVTRSLAQVLLMRVGIDATTNLRVDIYQRMVKASISRLEELGESRLLAAITMDVRQIVGGAAMAPNILVAAVTLFGTLCYVYVLQSEVFKLVFGVLLFGLITYQIPAFIGRLYIARSRVRFDDLQESIRGLICGVKELKLNSVKQRRYFKEILLADEHAVGDGLKRGSTITMVAGSYGDLLSFFLIGILTYIFVNYHAISNTRLVAIVMVLIYVSGSVAAILNSIPQVIQATVSFRSVTRLFAELSQEEADENAPPPERWNTLRLCNVSYRYGASAEAFNLGPIDLEIEKGQITFIVGGNGSGKSTLCKLIALHYAPTDGEMYFGRVRVNRHSINSCRQSIAAIFSDYFLFDRLLDGIADEDYTVARRYLAELDLDRKVSIVNGRFSTILLSEGQKKRLALLAAFLEDRDLYVFDEWAADQDPEFKRVFYYQILPALKLRGKAVVVISHDDRYFDVADQLITIEDGGMSRTAKPTARAV